MKKPVRIAIIALAVIIALTAIYLVAPGFNKMGNVFIVNYSVSEDPPPPARIPHRESSPAG